jgi:hypothetical protein
MVTVMRWTVLLFLPMLAGAAEIAGSNVRTVYIMSMQHGLDQYIANQLTREHVLDVVADPVRADAIFTDRLGEPLEAELEKLHPTPKPPAPKEETASEKEKDSPGKEKDNSGDKDKPAGSKTYRDAEPPHTSSFGRGKGTMFLVDAHSRVILWSIYEKPTLSNPAHLDGTAKRIVNRLKLDLAGK